MYDDTRTRFETLPERVRQRVSRLLPWFKRHRAKVLISLGVTLTVIVSFTLVWHFFITTHKVDARIDSFSWVRKMEVEDFQPRSRGDWSSDVPNDAYNRNEYWRYWYTSTSCSGTGKNQVCISTTHYRWWTDYTVDRWETSGWLVTGADGQHALWAGIENEGFDNSNVIGHRRLGNDRVEVYNVYVTQLSGDDKNKQRHQNAPFDVWRILRTEQMVKLNVNAVGDVRSVNWPKP